jgi:hypothetical protein
LLVAGRVYVRGADLIAGDSLEQSVAAK